ncbi:tetratricopeptide repeat protein [Lentibacter algarum]|uniref:tetratricopeptide repeat protein n=1 Tax=Lentibacter algarum TaxID=576131 RepID=UPI001C07C806|nr:tetratricopeptide repeat protein [Lentibacter algarum]MBU2981804.1 tetratricopeptide repeat protein [Lentibacter algarum]
MRFLLVLLLLAAPAVAETCPKAADHSVRFAELVEAVRAAPNEAAARVITNEMWALWADAPDGVAQEILDRGMQRRAGFDLVGALGDFDKLVQYCPDYAEGYNQRAYVHFIRQDYAKALVDLDRAIELSPTHIAALSGRALTYFGLGRLREARADLELAVGLNPWLPERRMLRDPAMKGQQSDL